MLTSKAGERNPQGFACAADDNPIHQHTQTGRIMITALFTRLCLNSASTASEVSQPVGMGGANSVQVDSVVFAQTATNVSFQLQSSNDLENWANQGSAETHSGVGYKLLASIGGVAAAYVRLKVTLTGAGLAIVTANINTSHQ